MMLQVMCQAKLKILQKKKGGEGGEEMAKVKAEVIMMIILTLIINDYIDAHDDTDIHPNVVGDVNDYIYACDDIHDQLDVHDDDNRDYVKNDKSQLVITHQHTYICHVVLVSGGGCP